MLYASPASELNSPVQTVRDAAAQAIRTGYTSPSRTNWEFLLTAVKVGDSTTNVWQVLRPLKATAGKGRIRIRDGKYLVLYRLDERWVLMCRYDAAKNTVKERELEEIWSHAETEPPKGFSGIWVTYWGNGQKHEEDHYTNGFAFLEISYNPDGSRNVITHNDSSGGLDDVKYYFPSGQLQDHFYWHQVHGSEVLTVISCNEDGSTNRVIDQPANQVARPPNRQ
jgi:hypothetical protein